VNAPLLILALLSGAGQPPNDPPDPKAEAEEARATAKKLAAEYVFHLDKSADRKLRLEPEPVFRWTSELGRRFYSDVYVWTHEGRPEVVASITSVYGKQRKRETEIHSLSLGRPVLSHGEKELWEPERPGLEFKPVPAAPKPGATAAARLLQLRTLAAQFSVVAEYDADKWDLRLLRAPVYRYQSPDNQVLDGGLFAFAKGGTDPEAFLMLEARGKKGAEEWQFAFVRYNGYCTLRAVHDEREVWKVDKPAAKQLTDPKQPYFCLRK
jgi:hypothetical protein